MCFVLSFGVCLHSSILNLNHEGHPRSPCYACTFACRSRHRRALRGKRGIPLAGWAGGTGKELLKTSLPESAAATVEKIADAMCLVDASPDFHYAVKLADNIYNCDEEATGMIANSATTVVAESLALKSRLNHNGLAVGDEWGSLLPIPIIICTGLSCMWNF